MESVTIDGVEYVKASVLAKKHGYTTDYIGQLCRAKKVDAHLVGRTWYVFPPTLEAHKSTRYAELRTDDKTKKIRPEYSNSRQPVPVPVPPKPVEVPQAKANFEQRIVWKPLRYEDDATDLLPAVKKSAHNTEISTKLSVDLAEAEHVTVSPRSLNTRMQSEPLPAVALSGTLRVLDYSPDFSSEDSIYQVKHSDSAIQSPILESAEDRLTPKKEVVVSSEESLRHDVLLRQAEKAGRSADIESQLLKAEAMIDPVMPEVAVLYNEPLRVPDFSKKRQDRFPLVAISFVLILLALGLNAVFIFVEVVTLISAEQHVAQLSFDKDVSFNFSGE